tara:strand:- start:1150 stop:1374 length:225 start_codon:yes stop_codon:yes gene_type:complete
MDKKEHKILNDCVKVLVLMSDRLDTVFKAVETIQKHIISESPKITYDTRVDMFKDNHSSNCECNGCFENTKEEK